MTYPAVHDAGLSLTSRAGHGGYLIVALNGDLDIASAPALREQLLTLLHRAASRLIIDLSAVGYADASGLAVLMASGRRAGLLGGSLRVAAPSPEVDKALSGTGIGQHLEIFPTVQAAMTGRRSSTAHRTPGPASPQAWQRPSPHARAQAGPGAWRPRTQPHSNPASLPG